MKLEPIIENTKTVCSSTCKEYGIEYIENYEAQKASSYKAKHIWNWSIAIINFILLSKLHIKCLALQIVFKNNCI